MMSGYCFLLKTMKENSGFRYQSVTADCGYESEEADGKSRWES